MKFVHRMMLLAVIGVVQQLAAQDWAKVRLEKSPRHLEFVKVKVSDQRTVESFIAFPEVKNKAPAVIVIHEIFGLSDWVRGVCDQLAEAGYIAIAPDLLSGLGPNGGGTRDLGGGDAVRNAIRMLKPDQITKDLDAVAVYLNKEVPSFNGKLAVGGFCWGGGQSLRYATNNPKLSAAMIFYGMDASVKAEQIAKIACPVYGFYGENDNRINASIDGTKELMSAAKKNFEPVIYKGAGHGFMRAGEAPDANPENKQARIEGWERIKKILKPLNDS